MKNIFLSFLFAYGFLATYSQNIQQIPDNKQSSYWTLIDESELVAFNKVYRRNIPSAAHYYQLDLEKFKAIVEQAPKRFQGIESNITVQIPVSDGTLEWFQVYDDPILHPDLASKFPMIKTYVAQGIDDPTAYMRFSITQFGLHTMTLSGNRSTNYIDPYTENRLYYIVYDRSSMGMDNEPFECLTDDGVNLPSLEKNVAGTTPGIVQKTNDQTFRIYRLAQSCTAEYGNIFESGGGAADIQAQMAITVNRVNSVYEVDLAIQMQFISNNDQIIYWGATNSDPWTNEWNTTTAQTIDAVIGVNNYDIGHNFNTTGGGNAGCLSCVCRSVSQTGTHKGRGYTGRANPTGDPFDIDYVAHEYGHQFGAYHTMNTCSRSGNGSTEVEPCSGSSIMGYAGICAVNVQNNSDAHFNYVNVRDVSANVQTGWSTCAQNVAITNNPPTADAGDDYTIPYSTAFILEGAATDADGTGSLTYNWSQNDPEQAPNNNSPQSTWTQGPNYRSIYPISSPNRYMPDIADVIAGDLTPTWEVTPSVGRTMEFAFMVRDNDVQGGQTDDDLMQVTVDGTRGPFVVTSQNGATTWTAGTSEVITWNVAGTTGGAINTANVDIFFSIDGGFTYPITLATATPNDGSHTVNIPAGSGTTQGKVMVRGSGNIFYALNGAMITVIESDFSISSAQSSINVCAGTDAVYDLTYNTFAGFNETTAFSTAGEPAGSTITFSPTTATSDGASVTMTVSGITAPMVGSYTITITGTATSVTKTTTVDLNVLDSSPAAVTLTSPTDGSSGESVPVNLTWSAAPAGVTYDIEISTNNTFTNIVESATGLSTNSYSATTLSGGTTYYWRVLTNTICGSGSYSSTFSFTTSNCTTIASTDIPISISSSGSPTIMSDLNIGLTGTITDINVLNLTGQHTYVSDLTFTLTSPQNTSVVLFDGLCGNLNDWDINMDDAGASAASIPCPPTNGGTYQSQDPLSDFNGEDPNGTWTLTIDDNFNQDGGSLDTWSLEVCIAPPTCSVSASAIDVSCNLGNDGVATANPTSGTGPYTYLWSNGDTDQSASGLSAGSYTVTMTDALACTFSASTSVSEPIALGINVTTTDESCGLVDGTATAIPSGGAGGYTYAWSSSANTGQTESNLSTGSVDVTVTDANTCSITATGSIGAITGPSTSISVTDEACGQGNGTATAIPSGGTSPYNYNWSSGGTNQTESNLSTGGIIVTVTDANTCSITISSTINNIAGPAVVVTTTDATCGANNGTATAIPSGGSSPYGYNWSSSGSNQTESGLSVGNFDVTISDLNGCTITANTSINNLGGPSITVSSNDATCGINNGTASVLVSGGNSPLSYQWSSGGSSSTENGLGTGMVSVTVTDNSSCETSGSTNISMQNSPTLSTAAIDASCSLNNGSITVTPSGGSSPLSYSWSSGGSTNIENSLGFGTFSVTVTDANSCTVTASQLVNNTTPIVSTSVTKAACGSSTGSIEASASGGITPYSYNWSSGGNSSTESGLTPGVYGLTVMDALSCTAVSNVTVTSGGSFTSANVTTTIASCGANNGTATALSSGGTSPYSFNWSSGGTSSTETGLVSGNYIVSITDFNGCIITATGNVGSTSGLSVSLTSNDASCNQANGSIISSVAGGTSPYTYLWSNALTTPNINSLVSNTYSVTVTDNGGCNAVQSDIIGNTSGPSLSTNIDHEACNNGNGSITVTATGGSTPYSYNWSTGGTSSVEINLAAGNYSVSVEDGNACVVTTSASVVNLNGPSIAVSPVDATCGASNGSASSSVTGGTSPYSYNWSSGGSNANESGLSSGNYFVTVTDINGCSAVTSFFINTSGITVNSSFTNETCSSSNGTASVTVTGASAPINYSWSNGGTSSSETGLTSGGYSVTIIDNNGCTAFESFNLNNNPAPVLNVTSTNASCSTSNAIATANVQSGTAPFTYNWSSGGSSNSESGLNAGAYSLTVTDANTCSVVTSFNVSNVAPIITSSASNASCGNANGSALVSAAGGTIPYSYQWSSGGTSNVESNLSSGAYDVTVNDAGGCIAYASVTIGDTPSPSLTTTTTDATCGGNNGSATVIATSGTSPYSYLWSSGANSSTANNLSAGTYSVIVTDNLGCSSIANVMVNNPGNISAVATTTDETCSLSNGEASLSITGGTAPYSVTWSGGAGSGTSATGLSAGSYTATILDVNSCVAVQNINITNVSGPSITSLNTTDEVCDLQNGSAVVNSSGGSSPISINWSNGANSNSISGLTAGTYSVTIVDNNGCTDISSGIVGDQSGPTIAASGTNEICSASNGTGNVVVNGGTAPFVYIWSSGGLSTSESGLSTGAYNVTVIDSNGCLETSSISIANEQPNITVTSNDANCELDNGTASVNVSGGSAPYTYLWSSGSNSSSISSLSSGSYSISVIDGNNCIISESILINSITAPALSTTITNAICNEANGSASIAVTGGEPPYTYSWSGTASNSTIADSLSGGTYSAFVTDNDGCMRSTLIIIGNSTPPSLTVTETSATCDADNGIAVAEAEGGTGVLTYEWSNGDIEETTSALSEGTYFVTVTDDLSCSVVDTAEIIRLEGICLEIPSGFSPNGDNVNDYWNIYGAEYYSDITVEVYNRWGSLLFESTGYNEPWTGLNSNGKEVPAAVYYYIVILGDETRTGTVTIKR